MLLQALADVLARQEAAYPGDLDRFVGSLDEVLEGVMRPLSGFDLDRREVAELIKRSSRAGADVGALFTGLGIGLRLAELRERAAPATQESES